MNTIGVEIGNDQSTGYYEKVRSVLTLLRNSFGRIDSKDDPLFYTYTSCFGTYRVLAYETSRNEHYKYDYYSCCFKLICDNDVVRSIKRDAVLKYFEVDSLPDIGERVHYLRVGEGNRTHIFQRTSSGDFYLIDQAQTKDGQHVVFGEQNDYLESGDSLWAFSELPFCKDMQKKSMTSAFNIAFAMSMWGVGVEDPERFGAVRCFDRRNDLRYYRKISEEMQIFAKDLADVTYVLESNPNDDVLELRGVAKLKYCGINAVPDKAYEISQDRVLKQIHDDGGRMEFGEVPDLSWDD